ncbi:MAG: hypothetical protein ACM3JG_18355 [Thiohalocapsa sp.]
MAVSPRETTVFRRDFPSYREMTIPVGSCQGVDGRGATLAVPCVTPANSSQTRP